MTRQIERNVEGGITADLNHKVLARRGDPIAITEQFCSKIKSLGFPFRGGPEEKEIRNRFDAARKGMIGAPSYAVMGVNLQEDSELGVLDTKRKEILGKLIEEGGEGLLFLTNSLSVLNGPTPSDTKLKCTPESKASDAEAVGLAASEAIQKTREYAGRLNNTIHPKKLNLESQRAELDELVKIAPGAVGEALNYSHPAAASLVCGSLSRLQQEDAIQDFKDGAVMWGSMVVGVATVLATRGATLPVVMAAYGVSAAAGAGAAIYSWDESGEAKALADIYREAAIAQGGDPNLLNMSKEEFLRFKEQRFNAVLSGAFSAFEFANLFAVGAKSGKSMAQINAEIERIAANPSEKGNWFKQGAKNLAADAVINTALSTAANAYTLNEFKIDPSQVVMGMLISASVRRLGKVVSPEDVGVMKTDLDRLQKNFRSSYGRDPTAEELMAAYERVNLKEVEIVSNKSSSSPKGSDATKFQYREDGTIIGVTDRNRAKTASEVLARDLPPEQAAALQKAHEIGRNQIGKDGGSAGLGNYTQTQIRQKAEILKNAGFSDAEIRMLMEKGLAGDELGRVSFGDFDAASSYQPGRAVSVRRSGGAGYTNAVISKVNPDGTYVVEWYEGGQHLQKSGVPPSMIGDYMAVEAGHIARGQEVSIPTAGGVSNGRVLEVMMNGRVRVEVVRNGKSTYHEIPTSVVMDPIPVPSSPRVGFGDTQPNPDPKPSLMDRMKKVFGGSSKNPKEQPPIQEKPKVAAQPESNKKSPTISDPNKREWNSKKGDDYVSRGGAVVRVDFESPALNRVVNDAVATIEQVTGIKAGGDMPLTDAQRKQVYEAWLNHVVPKIEDPDRTPGVYSNKRDQIISIRLILE